jgi:hypothetical protein
MATIKQIEANRLNAQKSTGPKTPEGKAVTKLNALRHGLRARTVVLPAEKSEDFHQLCNDLEAEWQPQSRTEQFYLEQMAVSQWKLARVEVAEKSILEQEFSAQSQIPLVDKLWQCQHRLERSYARAQRELERLQDSRRRQVQHPEDPAPTPQPAASAPQVMSAAAAAGTGPQRVPNLRLADRPVKPSEDTTASPDLVDGARRGVIR